MLFKHTFVNNCILSVQKKQIRIFRISGALKEGIFVEKNQVKNGMGFFEQTRNGVLRDVVGLQKRQTTTPFNLPLNHMRTIIHRNYSDTSQSHQPLEIHVKDLNELQPILQLFPHPKNTLNSFFTSLSGQLKDPSLLINPTFKKINQKHNPAWSCCYQIKWPENLKIVATDKTKKNASFLAASKVLECLLEKGKISKEGIPVVHSQQEIKQLTRPKQIRLKLSEACLRNMQNIAEVYENRVKNLVNSVDFNEYLKQGLRDDTISDEIRFDRQRSTGTAQFLAREKIQLPISKYKDLFINILLQNRCVIVQGEPGCGKSTRIPQYVLESWIKEENEQSCRIAVTQPRRIAAISLAHRVAEERDEEVGQLIGYQVRLKSNFNHATGRVLYCTTGLLLRHIQANPKLSNFSHVILDEAHERDVNTDLLMNLLKRALRYNSGLKVVVMSATIDTKAFSEYFDNAPIFKVPGFTYPVERHFLDSKRDNVSKTLNVSLSNIPSVVHEEVAETIKYIHKNRPEGAILVFLSGWDDLAKVQKLMGYPNDMSICMIHSKLKDSDQAKIFSKPPPGIRKVILSTNIAETSITIDDVVYVIDCGVHKDKRFDNDKGINVIDVEWISKASANQRAGRAGRCSPGECFHLYSKERYDQFSEYSDPKILNSSLTKVVLDTKVFSNNMKATEFMNSLISPPDSSTVEKAVDELQDLDLLDASENLTPLGRTLANFQMEPRLGKALINGFVFKCFTPILDIVTLFSSDTDIFGSASLIDKEDVRKIKLKQSGCSDHLALMRIYEQWEYLYNEDRFAARNYCLKHKLSFYKMDFVRKLKQIHYDYIDNGLHKCMTICDDFSDNDELVKAVLFSGTGTLLTHRNWDMVKSRLKTNVNVLVTRNNQKATITAESVNYKRKNFPTDFLAYINETRSNIRRTTIVRESSLIPIVSVLLFTNKKLGIYEPEFDNESDEDKVIIGVKGTKLQFLCDKMEANIVLKCKSSIDLTYKYLIHQLTYKGDPIPEFSDSWNDILTNLSNIMSDSSVK